MCEGENEGWGLGGLEGKRQMGLAEDRVVVLSEWVYSKKERKGEGIFL